MARPDVPALLAQLHIPLAHNDWPIVQQETFGPILYLIPVDSL
jgi:acyl-CoA reductase-like NAD-dependent aldehyde dehydrogenase